MKNISSILIALFLVTVLSFSLTSVFAHEDGDKEEITGEIVDYGTIGDLEMSASDL